MNDAELIEGELGDVHAEALLEGIAEAIGDVLGESAEEAVSGGWVQPSLDKALERLGRRTRVDDGSTPVGGFEREADVLLVVGLGKDQDREQRCAIMSGDQRMDGKGETLISSRVASAG